MPDNTEEMSRSRMFRKPLLQALDAASLRTSWYYTTGYDVNDRRVSMGGVVPDTGRNIAGLRNAISFLIAGWSSATNTRGLVVEG